MALLQRFTTTLVTRLFLFLYIYSTPYLHQVNTLKPGMKWQSKPYTKKDSTREPDYYRGTSLLNVCSKLYSYIINKRLSRWVEDNDVLGDIQAGFRKDHSTVDNIFTLFSVIQRHLLRNKKLCVAFIDFHKAFDFIAHCKLWPTYYRTGIKGKMLQTIQSMYRTVKARVCKGSKVTDAFFCFCFLPERSQTRKNNYTPIFLFV